MKNWERPVVEEINISETAHNWTGIYRDGGYIGDGIVSGHLSWSKPEGTNPGGTNPGGNDTNIFS